MPGFWLVLSLIITPDAVIKVFGCTAYLQLKKSNEKAFVKGRQNLRLNLEASYWGQG